MEKTKALVLISGGLDSILAVKVLQDQGVEVSGVCFISNFFNCEQAKKNAEENNIELQVIDISKELLAIIKNPASGVGKNINPCIDCHTLMLKKAKDYLDSMGYDFLATGEVLGQRPFSQNKNSLITIQEKVGIDILRPLSAQLLPKTEVERKGLVDGERLLAIEGRSREQQQELVEKYQIKNFSSPAGGCLLTDPEFGHRLSEMIWHWPNCDIDDVELLKYGRVFWFSFWDRYVLGVVGREKKDNDRLEYLKKPGDLTLELKEVTGPLTLVRNGKFKFKTEAVNIKIDVTNELLVEDYCKKEILSEKELLECFALLTAWYKTEVRGGQAEVKAVNIQV